LKLSQDIIICSMY